MNHPYREPPESPGGSVIGGRMIIENPTDRDAAHADLLARMHYEMRELWQQYRNPKHAQGMAATARKREEHQTATGWVADYDGKTSTYHYTDPKTRDGVTT